ncbi:MAG: HEPN domain-containing protein [Dysgonomonas sp.]
MHIQIQSHIQKLDHLYSKVEGILDPNDKTEWSKYLCVLTAGLIEESFRVLLLNHAKNNSSIEIQRFLEAEIKRITNCKTTRILEILTKYDPIWCTNFQEEIKLRSNVDNEIKDSIDSVVQNRHMIAHGKSVGISYSILNKYYSFVKKAIQILDNTIT